MSQFWADFCLSFRPRGSRRWSDCVTHLGATAGDTRMSTNPQGAAQSVDSITPTILMTMTGVTGIVDAVSFLALGRVFTANMTGNVMLLGFALGRTPGLSSQRSFLALAFFL